LKKPKLIALLEANKLTEKEMIDMFARMINTPNKLDTKSQSEIKLNFIQNYVKNNENLTEEQKTNIIEFISHYDIENLKPFFELMKTNNMKKLTYEQECFICEVIGEWYLKWENKLIDKWGNNQLGRAKEDLIEMICNRDLV
jgi:hypothetical protein